MTQIHMIENKVDYVTIVLKTKDENGKVHTSHSHIDFWTYMFNYDTIERIVKDSIPFGQSFVSYEVIDLRESEDITTIINSHKQKFVYI